MTTLIFFLFALALFHFVYESIIAPSIRLELRFELFKMRDELRQLKIEHSKSLDNKHFNYLQDSLNTLIANLYRFDIGLMASVTAELERDPELKERVEARSRIMDDCNIPRARALRHLSLRIAKKAFIVNAGGWAVFLVPVAIVSMGYAQLKAVAKAVASMSEPELAKALPAHSLTNPAY